MLLQGFARPLPPKREGKKPTPSPRVLLNPQARLVFERKRNQSQDQRKISTTTTTPPSPTSTAATPHKTPAQPAMPSFLHPNLKRRLTPTIRLRPEQFRDLPLGRPWERIPNPYYLVDKILDKSSNDEAYFCVTPTSVTEWRGGALVNITPLAEWEAACMTFHRVAPARILRTVRERYIFKSWLDLTRRSRYQRLKNSFMLARWEVNITRKQVYDPRITVAREMEMVYATATHISSWLRQVDLQAAQISKSISREGTDGPTGIVLGLVLGGKVCESLSHDLERLTLDVMVSLNRLHEYISAKALTSINEYSYGVCRFVAEKYGRRLYSAIATAQLNHAAPLSEVFIGRRMAAVFSKERNLRFATLAQLSSWTKELFPLKFTHTSRAVMDSHVIPIVRRLRSMDMLLSQAVMDAIINTLEGLAKRFEATLENIQPGSHASVRPLLIVHAVRSFERSTRFFSASENASSFASAHQMIKLLKRDSTSQVIIKEAPYAMPGRNSSDLCDVPEQQEGNEPARFSQCHSTSLAIESGHFIPALVEGGASTFDALGTTLNSLVQNVPEASSTNKDERRSPSPSVWDKRIPTMEFDSSFRSERLQSSTKSPGAKPKISRRNSSFVGSVRSNVSRRSSWKQASFSIASDPQMSPLPRVELKLVHDPPSKIVIDLIQLCVGNFAEIILPSQHSEFSSILEMYSAFTCEEMIASDGDTSSDVSDDGSKSEQCEQESDRDNSSFASDMKFDKSLKLKMSSLRDLLERHLIRHPTARLASTKKRLEELMEQALEYALEMAKKYEPFVEAASLSHGSSPDDAPPREKARLNAGSICVDASSLWPDASAMLELTPNFAFFATDELLQLISMPLCVRARSSEFSESNSSASDSGNMTE